MADGNPRRFIDARPAKPRLTQSYKRHLRAAAEARVEQLLALLDALDGDPDLEPNLGSNTQHQSLNQEGWAWTGDDDREVECEDEGAQCDDEGADQGDDEPNADDQDITWHVTPFAMDQQGTFWAYGERPLGKNLP